MALRGAEGGEWDVSSRVHVVGKQEAHGWACSRGVHSGAPDWRMSAAGPKSTLPSSLATEAVPANPSLALPAPFLLPATWKGRA